MKHVRRKAKLIAAKYDLTFPYELSQIVLNDCEQHGLPIDKTILPCGHYTSGKTPYKFLDGYHIVSYFVRQWR